MTKKFWPVLAGIIMLVLGVILFVSFQGTETPVIGLRQTGAVLAILGIVDLVAVGQTRNRSKE